MITLYTWKTPNGRKVPILLEELGLRYEVKPVDILHDEQFKPEFLAVSPNNKIPAIVDHDAVGGPLTLFESGAILTYLAEKTGRFLAAEGHEKYRALEWLHWQIGGLGPMLGQLGHFAVFTKEKQPTAIARFTKETERLFGVLDRRLAESPYLAGESYSIADIASYPWVMQAEGHLREPLEPIIAQTPHVRAWIERLRVRPAVERGMRILEG
mgnify:CR=1 FL=1